MNNEEPINISEVQIGGPTKYVPHKIAERREMVDACESIGKQVGYDSYEKKDKSLLYDLRRCKRYDRFLAVLDRLKGRVPSLGTDKEFLTYLDTHQEEWREYKSFISIFAKDYISSREYAESLKNKKKEGS
ncbi:hypothetical protein M1O19_04790 [Dehalococcoidia bacterium]|nr:hypothetical protein [Dehalococcoidia bacterium]MCL0079750.1 hypothetical protein [Dehalococcoidia bacterium]MCL0097818.1 hypothetical protein [Dehalococcoidia bacterium]